jgi:hypothetical protein
VTARSTDVTAKAGVGGAGWSTSAGFFDYDNDGRLILFVARYVTWSFEEKRYCGERRPGGPEAAPIANRTIFPGSRPVFITRSSTGAACPIEFLFSQ